MSDHSTSSRLGNALAFLAAIIATAGITSLIYANARAQQVDETSTSRPVAVTYFHMQDSYQRQSRYLGIVMAINQSELGFEIGGRVIQAPPHPGTQLTVGDVLARLDTRSLQARRKSLEAQLEQVGAELQRAQLQATRQQKLVSDGAVSQQMADDTRLQAKALKARQRAVRAQLQGIDLDLEKAVLRAPFDGTAGERYISQGSVVAAGTPLLAVVQNGPREAHIGLPSAQAKTLQLGQAYTLYVNGQAHRAVLRGLRADLNPQTRASTAVFTLPDNSQAMVGEPVSLRMTTTVASTGGWLPLSSLLEGDRGLWNVLRVEAQDGALYARREAVEIIEFINDRVYVRGTLTDGAPVIASGLHRITPGAQVTIAEQEKR